MENDKYRQMLLGLLSHEKRVQACVAGKTRVETRLRERRAQTKENQGKAARKSGKYVYYNMRKRRPPIAGKCLFYVI